MGVSDKAVGVWNLVTMLLSIPIIGAGIWLASKGDTTCERFLQWPVIILGAFLLVVSIMGFVGSCWRISCLLWVYLVVMFLLILLLFVFTIFAFVVTNKGAGEAVSGKGFKDYKLGDYSNWLQKQVNKDGNWKNIRSCLSDAKVCDDLDDDYPTKAQFDAAKLSPLESGCCKPPTSCGFTFVNATNWGGASTGTDPDCTRWRNDQKTLCFDCDSCKAGVLQNIKKDWRKVAIVLIVTLVILIAVYSIGCCAFRNARSSRRYSNFSKSSYP